MGEIVKPEKYFVIYENGYVEGGDFVSLEKESVFGPAHIVRNAELINVLGSSISANLKIYSHELISRAVILSVAFDSEYPSICWMIPAGFHFMKFDPAVNIPDDKYWMPTTLFKLNEERLDVAVANESIWKAFLKPDFEDYDEIYQSPYLNMLNEYTNCMGTAKPDNSHFTINEIVNVWTDNFFGATFNAIPDNLNISYQDYYLKAKTKTKFNKSDYGKLSTTIGSFCR